MLLPKKKVSDYDFSDLRLSKRFIKIQKILSEDIGISIPQAVKNKCQVKATYNFFKHKNVTPEKIYEQHQDVLSSRIMTYYNNKLNNKFGCIKASLKENRRILALSDTVELDYTGKETSVDLGPLTYMKRRGLNIHNTLLINDIGVPLELLDQKFIIRKDEDFGKNVERKNHPIETKESYKWYEHFVKTQSLLEKLPIHDERPYEMVYVADREGDIKELFQERQHKNMHYIIRSQHNRNVFVESSVDAVSPKESKLRDILSDKKVNLTYEVTITNPITKKKRIAKVQMKYSPVTLKMSKSLGAGYYKKNGITPPQRPYNDALDLYGIEVKEINPPDDIDKPIYWILLTSLPLNTIFDALQVIDYYILRWIIERFHYLLKSGGAKVENLNLKHRHQLLNALVTYSFAAMDILKLKYLAEKQPDLPIYEIGISPKQYEILYKYVNIYIDKKVVYLPDIEPKIKDFVIVLGQLGGFIPTKRQPIPGLKILSRAYQKLKVILETFDIFSRKNE